jgi:RHS repeat-associated protein
VRETDDYYPYGELIPSTPNTGDINKFTGKERDAESGLDNFGARYNASTMGRFMTPDWAAKPTSVPYAQFGDPQSLNLYTYVRNHPISQSDPDGHTCADPITCGIEIGGSIGTVVEPGGGTVVGAGVGLVIGGVLDIGIISYGVYKHFHPKQNQTGPKQPKSNPWQGKPGETSETTQPDGTPKQTRRYGPDGYPDVDVDRGHGHDGAPDPHAHDIGRPSDGSPPTFQDRGPARPLQPTDPQPQQQPQQTAPQQTPPQPPPQQTPPQPPPDQPPPGSNAPE